MEKNLCHPSTHLFTQMPLGSALYIRLNMANKRALNMSLCSRGDWKKHVVRWNQHLLNEQVLWLFYANTTLQGFVGLALTKTTSPPFCCLIQFKRDQKLRYFATLSVIVRKIAPYIMWMPWHWTKTGVFRPQQPRGVSLVNSIYWC